MTGKDNKPANKTKSVSSETDNMAEGLSTSGLDGTSDPDSVPKDQAHLLKVMFQSVLDLHGKVDKAIEKGTNLDKVINDPDTGIDTKINSSISANEENAENISQLKMEVSQLKEQVELLIAITQKQENEISSLKSEASDMKGRSMRDNIILSGLPETPKEDLEVKVRALLREIGVDLANGNTGPISFDRLHRFGTGSGKFPRPVVAKVHDYRDKVTILKAAPKLKDVGEEDDLKMYINEQYTDEVREKRGQAIAKIRSIEKLNLPETEKPKIKLALEKLYINGELQKPMVTRPSVQDVMNDDKDDNDKMNKLKLSVGQRYGERGNTFTGIAVKVRSVNEVRLALIKILKKPEMARAAHVMSAYVTKTGEFTKSGHYDDEEWGGGYQILKTINGQDKFNIAVFVVRHHPQTDYKLGGLRFKLIRDATTAALNKL